MSHVADKLKAYTAGQLQPAERAGVAAHLVDCADCARLARDAALDTALERALPRHVPSGALQEKLRRQVQMAAATAERPPAQAARPRRPGRWFVPSVLAAAGLAAALAVIVTVSARRPDAGWTLVDEAVTDHLRVTVRTQPVDVESGGIHQVKPWFTGRLDFAPRIAFSGDADFPLVGGSVGYVRERKAAIFTFRRRLHLITLLIFPADGLAWPAGSHAHLGGRDVTAAERRGFSTLFWREGDLAYALVSDVSRAELEALAQRINPS